MYFYIILYHCTDNCNPSFFASLSPSTAVSDYRQSLQFQSLNDEKRNIHMEVCFSTMWKCLP